jgi:hypothetical protein
MDCQGEILRPINGFRAMKIAFQYGISKSEIVEGMKNNEFPFNKGMLDDEDPETLLDDRSDSYFRAEEGGFTNWCIAKSSRRLDPESVQRMFAHIQLSIGYLRRELAQFRLEGRL